MHTLARRLLSSIRAPGPCTALSSLPATLNSIPGSSSSLAQQLASPRPLPVFMPSHQQHHRAPAAGLRAFSSQSGRHFGGSDDQSGHAQASPEEPPNSTAHIKADSLGSSNRHAGGLATSSTTATDTSQAPEQPTHSSSSSSSDRVRGVTEQGLDPQAAERKAEEQRQRQWDAEDDLWGDAFTGGGTYEKSQPREDDNLELPSDYEILGWGALTAAGGGLVALLGLGAVLLLSSAILLMNKPSEEQQPAQSDQKELTIQDSEAELQAAEGQAPKPAA